MSRGLKYRCDPGHSHSRILACAPTPPTHGVCSPRECSLPLRTLSGGRGKGRCQGGEGRRGAGLPAEYAAHQRNEGGSGGVAARAPAVCPLLSVLCSVRTNRSASRDGDRRDAHASTPRRHRPCTRATVPSAGAADSVAFCPVCTRPLLRGRTVVDSLVRQAARCLAFGPFAGNASMIDWLRNPRPAHIGTRTHARAYACMRLCVQLRERALYSPLRPRLSARAVTFAVCISDKLGARSPGG
eukprot:620075-Pleurochrysis_carterae.AAC.3